MNIVISCVEYSLTCPYWGISGCVPNCLSPKNSSNCLNETTLCLYAGDTVNYEVKATANLLGTSKYMLEAVVIINNDLKSNIKVDSIFIGSTRASFTPATHLDDYSIASGTSAVFSVNGFLLKNGNCTATALSFDLTVNYTVANNKYSVKEHYSAPQDSCSNIVCKCKDDCWSLNLFSQSSSKSVEKKFIEADETISVVLSDSITTGVTQNGIIKCSSTSNNILYTSFIDTTNYKECGYNSCLDSQDISLTIKCAVPAVSGSVVKTNYISTKWGGCKTAELYNATSSFCTKSPGFWSNHMTVEASEDGCNGCKNNSQNQPIYFWPPVNGSYYNYVPTEFSAVIYFSSSQACDILSQFSKCSTKPASGVMNKVYDMLRFLLNAQFCLYNIPNFIGSCKTKINDLIIKAKNAMASFFSSIIGKNVITNSNYNFYSAKVGTVLLMTKTNSYIDGLLGVGYSNTQTAIFNGLSNELSNFYQGLGQFANCGLGECDNTLSNNVSPCANKQLVYTLDLDVDTTYCVGSTLKLSIGTVECASYKKNIFIKVYYKSPVSSDMFGPFSYSGAQINPSVEINPNKTLDYVEVSYKATSLNLSNCYTTEGDLLIFCKLLSQQISNSNLCSYLNTATLQDTIVTIPNCAKTTIRLPDCGLNNDCQAFLKAKTYVLVSGEALAPISQFYCNSSTDIKDTFDALASSKLVNLNMLLQLITSQTCGFGGYSNLKIFYVIDVPDCATNIKNKVQIVNGITSANPCDISSTGSIVNIELNKLV